MRFTYSAQRQGLRRSQSVHPQEPCEREVPVQVPSQQPLLRSVRPDEGDVSRDAVRSENGLAAITDWRDMPVSWWRRDQLTGAICVCVRVLVRVHMRACVRACVSVGLCVYT